MCDRFCDFPWLNSKGIKYLVSVNPQVVKIDYMILFSKNLKINPKGVAFRIFFRWVHRAHELIYFGDDWSILRRSNRWITLFDGFSNLNRGNHQGFFKKKICILAESRLLNFLKFCSLQKVCYYDLYDHPTSENHIFGWIIAK